MFRTLTLRQKNLALAERFQQIVDEKLPHSSHSLVDKDPSLKKIYSQYSEDLEFQHKYQKELAYAKSEHLLRNKEARRVADTIEQAPWLGHEDVRDAAARMLGDKVGKPMIQRKPAVPPGTRLHNARESTIDYQTAKTKSPEDLEKEEFREMYRERLVGPLMFLNVNSPTATLGFASTLADARINAAIDRSSGQFSGPEMDTVRGKPLDRERLANSTDSNFFTNQILSNQECLPPWIESQQGVDRARESFRLDMQKNWFKLAVDDLSSRFGQSEEQLLRSLPHLSKDRLMPQFRKLHGLYIDAKLDALNKDIRSYNLQCPLGALHKWKLQPEAEIAMLFEKVRENMPQLLRDWAQQRRLAEIPVKKSDGSFLSLFEGPGGGGGSASGAAPAETPKIGFWKLIKDMWKS